MRRLMNPAILVLSLLLALSAIPAMAADEPAPPPLKDRYGVGDEFPPIQILDLDGKPVVVKNLLTAEKNYLVFFNTACGNCQLELKIFQDNYEAAKKKGIGVVAVGVDLAGPEVLKNFGMRKKYPFPLLSDKDYALAGKIGFTFTPATMVVDKSKKIVKVETGFDNEKAESLKKELQ